MKAGMSKLERRLFASGVFRRKQRRARLTVNEALTLGFCAGAEYEHGYILRALRKVEPIDWRGALNRAHEEKRRVYNENLRLAALLRTNGITYK